jgi:hypothetical protein
LTVMPLLFMLHVAGPALTDIDSSLRAPAAIAQYGCMSNRVIDMDFLGKELG